jgi:hypothetical protein
MHHVAVFRVAAKVVRNNFAKSLRKESCGVGKGKVRASVYERGFESAPWSNFLTAL